MKYKYMKTSETNIAVQMDPHVNRNKREQAFVRKFGIKPTIVSVDFWDYLSCSYPIETLEVEEK